MSNNFLVILNDVSEMVIIICHIMVARLMILMLDELKTELLWHFLSKSQMTAGRN